MQSPLVLWVSAELSISWPSLTADTPFFYPEETPEAVAWCKSQGMGNRLTEMGDIGPLVDFLCHDKWITGQIIFCKSLTLAPLTAANGGFTTR